MLPSSQVRPLVDVFRRVGLGACLALSSDLPTDLDRVPPVLTPDTRVLRRPHGTLTVGWPVIPHEQGKASAPRWTS